ncbi:MAG: ABC transporter permease [Actinomycetota bacterium]|nr:ABC transporter permease [Actinomycetota bacterium]
MSSLVEVEIRRLVARRLFKGLTLVVALACVAIGVLTFINSTDDPARVAAAVEQRREEIAQCVESVPTMMDGAPQPDAVDDPVQWCRDETYGSDPRFLFRDMQWILGTLGMPMIMLGWLLGASSIGAEWANRTVMTTLTWNARRVRVLAAKALAVGIVTFAWVMLLQGAFLASMYPAGAFEGSMMGVDGGWWADTLALSARAAGIGAMAALFGLSLATIGRNTAAALGIGFVYLAVVEGLVRAFKPSWVDWLIGDNVVLVVIGDLDVNHLGHSMGAAALLLAVYSVVLGTIAGMVFHRRDVA